MNYQIVTRDTNPQVIDLDGWRERYNSVKRAELGRPVVEIHSPAKLLYLTEKAIESALRDYGKTERKTGCQIAASIACALRVFRAGSSAATAIQQGQKRAGEL